MAVQFLGGKIQTMMDAPKVIMTGRIDSSGKLETGIIKQWNEMVTLRLSALYPNSDIN